MEEDVHLYRYVYKFIPKRFLHVVPKFYREYKCIKCREQTDAFVNIFKKVVEKKFFFFSLLFCYCFCGRNAKIILRGFITQEETGGVTFADLMYIKVENEGKRGWKKKLI